MTPVCLALRPHGKAGGGGGGLIATKLSEETRFSDALGVRKGGRSIQVCWKEFILRSNSQWGRCRTVRARCVHGARTVQCFWDGCPTCTPLNAPHRNTPRVLISAPCSPYWHTRILQFLV